MSRALVIGYGNPLREDDAVGPQAAETLENSFPPEQVRVITAHQLSPEMMEDLQDQSVVIFVDAAGVGMPGTISIHELSPTMAETSAFTHQMSPSALLAATRELYGRAPRAFLASISGASFEAREGLTPVLRAAFPDFVQSIKTLLERETAVHA